MYVPENVLDYLGMSLADRLVLQIKSCVKQFKVMFVKYNCETEFRGEMTC